MLIYRTSLIVTRLLEPKAGGGTVEQTDNGEVVVLGSVEVEFDDRSRAVKNFPAPVEGEMVVRGDFAVGDRQGRAEAIECDLMPFPPRQTFREIGALTKG